MEGEERVKAVRGKEGREGMDGEMKGEGGKEKRGKKYAQGHSPNGAYVIRLRVRVRDSKCSR